MNQVDDGWTDGRTDGNTNTLRRGVLGFKGGDPPLFVLHEKRSNSILPISDFSSSFIYSLTPTDADANSRTATMNEHYELGARDGLHQRL